MYVTKCITFKSKCVLQLIYFKTWVGRTGRLSWSVRLMLIICLLFQTILLFYWECMLGNFAFYSKICARECSIVLRIYLWFDIYQCSRCVEKNSLEKKLNGVVEMSGACQCFTSAPIVLGECVFVNTNFDVINSGWYSEITQKGKLMFYSGALISQACGNYFFSKYSIGGVATYHAQEGIVQLSLTVPTHVCLTAFKTSVFMHGESMLATLVRQIKLHIVGRSCR